jgi:hypothetical protein
MIILGVSWFGLYVAQLRVLLIIGLLFCLLLLALRYRVAWFDEVQFRVLMLTDL